MIKKSGVLKLTKFSSEIFARNILKNILSGDHSMAKVRQAKGEFQLL